MIRLTQLLRAFGRKSLLIVTFFLVGQFVGCYQRKGALQDHRPFASLPPPSLGATSSIVVRGFRCNDGDSARIWIVKQDYVQENAFSFPFAKDSEKCFRLTIKPGRILNLQASTDGRQYQKLQVTNLREGFALTIQTSCHMNRVEVAEVPLADLKGDCATADSGL